MEKTEVVSVAQEETKTKRQVCKEIITLARMITQKVKTDIVLVPSDPMNQKYSETKRRYIQRRRGRML